MLKLHGPILVPRPQPAGSGNGVGLTSNAAAAAGRGIAMIIHAPKTGNIRQIGFRTGTVTAGGDGLDCRVETVTGAPATPSGTLLATDTNVVKSIADTDDNVWIWSGNLTASAAVTAGDKIAIVVKVPAGGTFNGNLQSYGSQFLTSTGAPYTCTNTAGSWAASGTRPMMAIEYDDGTVPNLENVMPAQTFALVTFDSGSAQDEVGQTFVLPCGYRTIGYWVHAFGQAAVTAEYEARLYDGSATPTVALATHDPGYGTVHDFDTAYTRYGYWPTPVDVPANTVRRLMFRPLDADDLNLFNFTCADALSFEGHEGGDTIYRTSREKDVPGAWDEHSKLQRVMAGLIISHMDTGEGIGGLQCNIFLPRGVAAY